jgi:hypothetical protein
MPSSFTPSLRLTLPVTGENSGTWGDLVNTGITDLVDASIAGYAAITMTDANYTLTSVNGAADEARKMMLNMSGTLSAPRNVICPTASKLYFIKNATAGGFAITLKTSAGSGISVPNGRSAVLICNGTDVVEAVDYSANVNTTNISYTGTLTGGTGVVNLGSGQFYKDGSGNVGIGTASPAVPLEVVGQIRSRTASGTAPKISLFQNGVVSWELENAASTGVFGITNGVGYVLRSESLPSGTAIYINGSGNVGVGTATPASRLHVHSSAGGGDEPFIRLSNAGTGQTVLDGSFIGLTNTNELSLWNNETAPVRFATANAERMRIDSSGNVGIGTTSPGSTLDVKGTLRLSGSTSGYVGFAPAAAAGTTTYTLPTADGTSGQVLQTNGSATLSWATASVTPGSGNVGYLNIPQNSQSAAYTLVLADSGKHILHPSADTTARTFTIPANGTVAFPIGTAITFVNQNAAGTITIAITTDTMRLAGAGTTGSRTLTANGTATALKITATEWLISGVNLT